MKSSRCRTLLTVLVAACALGALTAASASAAFPEFRGTNEGKEPVAFTGSSGTVYIHFITNGKSAIVECTSSSISGTITNAKEVGKVFVTFVGGTCASYSFCRQGGKSGSWQTQELKGRIAYLSKSIPREPRIGLLLEPVAAPFAKCEAPIGGGVEKVVGSIIAEITPTNVKTNTFSLGIQENIAGEQQFTHFEGEEAVHRLETTQSPGGVASPAVFEFKQDKFTTARYVAVEG